LGRSSWTPRQRSNKELRQLLCSTQNNLDDIKKERDAMHQNLLDATERKPSEIKQPSKKDRSQLVVDIAKKGASSKAARKTMARTLAKSEKDRYEATQLENLQLTRELQRLSDQLTPSSVHADELISAARANQQIRCEKQKNCVQKGNS
jgi:hypothetical protein